MPLPLRRDLALPADPAGFEAAQRALAQEVLLTPSALTPALWGAVDVAYSKAGPEQAFAVAVVMDAQTHAIVETATWAGPPPHDYVPGLFALREGACLLAALDRLQHTPDVLLIDGQGIAHPRGFGLACQVGLALDVPTVGVAKQRLFGTCEAPEAPAGSWSPLHHPDDSGQVIGGVLRSQDGVKPLVVSPGHRCDVPTALRWAAAARSSHRMLAPIRAADIFTRQLRDGRPFHLDP